MNIYDVAELQQYLNPQVNQQSTQLIDPTMLFRQRSPLLGIQSQRLSDPERTLIPQIPGGIMTQAPLQNLGFDTSLGVANEEDVEQEFLPGQKKSNGIADLFRAILGFAIPGANFFLNKGRDALGGIRSLNQRLRNTDFARAKTLADYFDMKKYGGYEGREDARAATMAQARGIQKKIDAGDYGTRDISIDRGRGQITSRAPTSNKSRRDTSSSSSYSQASYDRRR